MTMRRFFTKRRNDVSSFNMDDRERQINEDQPADNSSRAFRVLRLLIIFTGACYFGAWIYAICFDDVKSWGALNFHVVMLGMVLVLLGVGCSYEMRKFYYNPRLMARPPANLNAEHNQDR